MNGCYAYNMAGYGKKCRRCGRKRMAGMGNSCSRSSSLDSVNSCNLRHRIEVYGRSRDPGCVYTEGITTGVMCCRKRGRRKFDVFNPPPFGSELSSLSQTESDNKQLPSVPQSINQGSINNNDQFLKSSIMYFGEDCSTYCGENGYCILPGICGCNRGYHGPRCQHRRQPRHRCHTLHCFNGGRCRRGKCKCPAGYWGKRCHKLAIFGDRKKHERRKNKRKTKSRTKCVKHLFRHFKLK
ncbi:tenascin-like [Lingula anatina]|uniref:Tenascin-like n=1 Tax=Lingula anatina TaxID=7574 RepID=A0A1S3IR06_LINAN|nr:tenascin-like [Lingula anatina]|eukprot:XP_013400351.1 tenascin-like [Lingula anatina]